MPNAEIVSIGSELLLGQIVDTNASWLASRLTDLGVNLFYKSVVGDNPGRMQEVLNRALERSDIVITGGGLGPTQDDLTREAIAAATGRDLVVHPDLIEQIESRFRRRGMIMTANNERQARIPEGATPVNNPNGTAPSFVVEDPRGVVFALPGVPFELKWLFDNEVAPYLRRRFGLTGTIVYRVLKVAEIGESNVDDRIGHLIAELSNPTVGVLAHPGQVDIRIAAKASDADEAMKLIAPVEEEVRRLLGRHVFAADEATIEQAVGTLLRESGRTVSVFEDATGGMLAGRLYQSAPDQFASGVIGNGGATIVRLDGEAGRVSSLGATDSPEELTRQLASAIRSQGGSGSRYCPPRRSGPDRAGREPGQGPDVRGGDGRGGLPRADLPVRRPGQAGPDPDELQCRRAASDDAAGGFRRLMFPPSPRIKYGAGSSPLPSRVL